MIRVLGIDPGLRLTGYALLTVADGRRDPALEEAGVIRLKVPKNSSNEQVDALASRLGQLDEELGELIERLKPDEMVVEKLYAHYRHPRTSILMGHARGVILNCAFRRDVLLYHLPATEVKKSIAGHGHASKEQIQQAVADQCGLDAPPTPADVADAIAIGLCHARRRSLTV